MKNDPHRLDALLSEHYDALGRLAISLAGGGVDAGDLQQETWRVATEKADSLGSLQRPGAYLAGIMRRLAWRARRDLRGSTQKDLELVSLSAPQPLESLELSQVLHSAIRRLPTPLQEVVVARYLDGHPPRVIAQITKVPLETVKDRLKRALVALRVDLNQSCSRDEPGGWQRRFLVVFGSSLEGTSPNAPIAATSALPHVHGQLSISLLNLAGIMAKKTQLVLVSALLLTITYFALDGVAPQDQSQPLISQEGVQMLSRTGPSQELTAQASESDLQRTVGVLPRSRGEYASKTTLPSR